MKTYIGIKVNSQMEYEAVAELVATKFETTNRLNSRTAFENGYRYVLYGVEENRLYHDMNFRGSYGCDYVDSKAETVREFIDFVNDYKNPKIKIVLNDKYTAEVAADKVVVGCQTFEAQKILEVAEAIRKLQEKKTNWHLLYNK